VNEFFNLSIDRLYCVIFLVLGLIRVVGVFYIFAVCHPFQVRRFRV
jgi:hypothetical protein